MQKTVLTKRRKLFLSIALSVLAVFGIFGLAACSNDVTEQDIIDLGYKIAVVYDYQGGVSNDKQSVKVRVKENSRIPASGTQAIGVPTKKGYSFKGFNLAVLDEDGKPVLDKNDNMIPSDTEWNFAVDKVEDKDVYLCATYWENYTVVLHYGVGTDYTNTQNIEITRNQDGTPNSLFASNLKVKDYTFLSYEFDAHDGKKPVATFPFALSTKDFDQSDDKLTAHVWGDAIEGNFTLIGSAKDLLAAPIGESVNYYLLDDIDLQGAEYDDETASTKLPKVYSGKFVGNEHTISNLTLNLKTLDNTYRDFGLFRSLGATAEISDVFFENIVINTELSNNNVTAYNLGMLAGQANAGAKVSNVKITTGDGSSVNNAFSYKLGVGIDPQKVNVANDLTVAVKSESATVECTVDKVDLIASDAIYSDDKSIAIYITYRIHDGVATLVDTEPHDVPIYGLAIKSSSGNYSSKTIKNVEKTSEFKYSVEQLNKNVYDVTFTIDGATISAAIVQQTK